MLRSKLIDQMTTGLLLVAVCLPSYGQDATEKYDEAEIKAAVEHSATSLDVCLDQTLLKIAQIEDNDCERRLAFFAPVCWHLIDGLELDYEIPQSEAGKERFISLSLVYTSCIRSELLRQIVRSKRE